MTVAELTRELGKLLQGAEIHVKSDDSNDWTSEFEVIDDGYGCIRLSDENLLEEPDEDG